MNAQSVVRKMDELRAIADIKKPGVIAITETWTNESIDEPYLKLDGYELIEREDRIDTDKGRGGGILVFVRREISAWREVVNGNFCQCVCVKLKDKRREMAIYVVYRSPNSSTVNDDLLYELIRNIRGRFVMVGDFNFPGIRWGTGGSDKKSRAFYDVILEKCLTQHVETPTHISGNVLDLVISSEDDLVQSVSMEGRLGKSDHEMIAVKIGLETVITQKSEYTRNYRKANYTEMRERTRQIDWMRLFGESDVEGCWMLLKEFFNNMEDEFVPLKRKRNSRAPAWMDGEVRAAIREKKKTWDRWKRSRRDEDKKAYKSMETRVKKLVKNRKIHWNVR